MLPLSSPIFVDASAWIALLDRRDRHHEQARQIFEACFARRVRLVTTTWTAYEALSLLTDRSSVTLVRVTEDIENRALNLFFAYQDKTWGVVDCANLGVMEDLGCPQSFGFDHHFVEASRQRGFELLRGVAQASWVSVRG
jgi:predicted nucleic acid-binding protein